MIGYKNQKLKNKKMEYIKNILNIKNKKDIEHIKDLFFVCFCNK